jgi:mitochondrial fission protein ELM1
MESQARGLAEASSLEPSVYSLVPRAPWRYVTARFWPNPRAAFTPEALPAAPEGVVIGIGGTGGVVASAFRNGRTKVVAVQDPRLSPARFDLLVVNRHDHVTGPNVITIRNALHRVTTARLAESAAAWAPRLAHLPRPLVAVLLGGSNGRHRLDAPVARALAHQLASMMRTDRAGLIVTPSRRTGPDVTLIFRQVLQPLGAEVWDGTGENPYFGMLALADAVIVTQDSVSMISEAVATTAPVMVAMLPGRSRRQEEFLRGLIQEKRVRPFAGRLESWPCAVLNDTPAAGAELRLRLGF